MRPAGRVANVANAATWCWLCGGRRVTTSAAASSIECEALRSDGGSEAATLASGRLARLVFGPAIEVRIAEDLPIALFLSRRSMASCSPLIVSIHQLGQPGIVILIRVGCYGERKPHADMTGRDRITDAKACNGNDARRQGQDLRHSGQMVANDTDRATPQADPLGSQDERLHHEGSVDRGVEEGLQVRVRLRVSPQRADARKPPGVGAKYEKRGGAADPRH